MTTVLALASRWCLPGKKVSKGKEELDSGAPL